eukprot:g2988.t1
MSRMTNRLSTDKLFSTKYPTKKVAPFDAESNTHIKSAKTNAINTQTALHTIALLTGTWIFDAGEGALCGIFTLINVRKIFVTHMHGDHVNGLCGMICRISAVRNNSQTSGADFRGWPLDIYGPPGLAEYIRTSLRLTHSKPKGLRYRVHEFVTDSEDVPRHVDRLHHNELPPVFMRNDSRSADKKNVWRVDGHVINSEQNVRDFDVVACEIRHARGVRTLGYVVTEPDIPRKLLIDRVRPILEPHKEWLAKERNISWGDAMSSLKLGKPVPLPDGTSLDPAVDEILGPNRPGRRVCVLGDTFDASDIAEYAHGVDLLVHEASHFGGVTSKFASSRGHSTARMAGQFARKIEAKTLLMNHVGPECNTRHEEEVMRREAASAWQGGFRNARVARDGYVFEIDPPP